jgi:2-desacetyl-2-hydroxyethyl bacteriochlorophyllide A dehydrogenase
MKTLVCVTPGDFQYKKAEVPKINHDEALIMIKKIGICGTDLHAFEGTQPYFDYPRILGHELAADFIEGEVEGFTKGEAVTIMPYFACNNCIACLNGKPNCCVDLKVCGVHQDGGMVEYLKVPSRSLVKGNGLSYNQLALIEPLAIGAHSIQRAQIKKGEFVLVVGAGPIGLGIMEMARIAGANVIAMDVNNDRLQFCSDKLKVHYSVNPKEGDALKKLRDITSGGMPTVVIDATGNLQAINKGFEYIAHGGRYVLVGLQKQEVTFSHPLFHKKELTLMSSRNATKKDFDTVIDAVKNNLINVDRFITHTVMFDSVKQIFPDLLNPQSGVIKAIIEL